MNYSFKSPVSFILAKRNKLIENRLTLTFSKHLLPFELLSITLVHSFISTEDVINKNLEDNLNK